MNKISKQIHDQVLNQCRHFNGTVSKVCEAGVRYEDVRLPREEAGTGWDLPCLKNRCEKSTCEKREWNTEEDARREEEEIAKLFGNTRTARAAIVKHSEGKRGVRGSLPCPVCTTGTLHYSVASCNGHIHARCSKEGCVAWME